MLEFGCVCLWLRLTRPSLNLVDPLGLGPRCPAGCAANSTPKASSRSLNLVRPDLLASVRRRSRSCNECGGVVFIKTVVLPLCVSGSTLFLSMRRRMGPPKGCTTDSTPGTPRTPHPATYVSGCGGTGGRGAFPPPLRNRTKKWRGVVPAVPPVCYTWPILLVIHPCPRFFPF